MIVRKQLISGMKSSWFCRRKHRVINMLVLGHWLSDYRWRLRNQQVQGGGEIYEGYRIS